MLSLIFPKQELTSASISVRWCLDAESLDKVFSNNHKPFIIFKIHYRTRYRTEFQIFPVDQFSAYLDLHYAGKTEITAFIVTADNNNIDLVYRMFVSNTSDRETLYSNTKYSKIRFKFESDLVGCETYEMSEQYSFEIDENLFGKELSDTTKFFLNRYWYRDKPKDQCDVRRRLMMWPFTTMIPLFFEFLFRMLWNIAYVFTFWSIGATLSYKHLIHPFSKMVDNYDCRNADWLPTIILKKIYKNQEIPSAVDMLVAAFAIPLLPLIVFISFMAIWLNSNLSAFNDWYLILAYGIGGTYAIITGLIALVTAIIFIANTGTRLFTRFISFMEDKCPKFIEVMLDKFFGGIEKINMFMYQLWNRLFPVAYDDHTKSMLICPNDEETCLPPIRFRDKSIKLMFADLKNKVCKPLPG